MAADFFRRVVKAPGTPPGVVLFTGEASKAPVSVEVFRYSKEEVSTTAAVDPATATFDLGAGVTWINVNGVHDTSVIKALGAQFDLHPLVQEDVASIGQRPKAEAYEGYQYIVLKMLHAGEEGGFDVEQVSLVVREGLVISFQEYAGDVFEPIRQRLLQARGRIRELGADYLAYTLIDTIVDHYFAVIERVGSQIDETEEILLQDVENESLVQINALKREAILLRKAILPLREVLNAIQRSEAGVFKRKTLVFLRDVQDHVAQVADTLESYRDLLGSLTDLYMSSLSQKMNAVMQVLTIIGTIFIPLTFVAGIYGMNFDHMPELHWPYGYPVIMGLMLAIGLALVLFFRRKKWL